MEYAARIKKNWIDIKNIGIYFYIPIGVMVLNAIYCFLIRGRYGVPIEIIRENYGVFSVICISFWVPYLFEDLLNSDGREMLLSMPYRNAEYGLIRVLKYTVLYIGIFYLFLALIILTMGRNVILEAQDIYLPVLSIFFYSAFNFFVVVVARNSLVVMIATGALSVFIYLTRGGASFYIYPLQWSNPNPFFMPYAVGIVLFICSLILYAIGQILFSNRDFLMR
ncbi:MAG TPA: hypothetical protein VFC98_00095 [Clostridia bacterium]|nr:hypothetical protein [Clostridia bacterium]